MECNSNNDESFADLVARYRSGITQTTTDGTSVSFDSSRTERVVREAAYSDPCALANGPVRPLRYTATMRYFR